jgi:hypothetical protein
MSERLTLGDIVVAKRTVFHPFVNAEIEHGDDWVLVVLAGTEGAAHPEFADIRVAPVSTTMQMAADLDLLCKADEGPLGQDFFIEVWNQRPMLFRNVREKIGRLADGAVDRLVQMHNYVVGGHGDEIDPTWRGSALIDNDPRNDYQLKRAERAAFLSDPADELLGIPQGKGNAQFAKICIWANRVSNEPPSHFANAHALKVLISRQLSCQRQPAQHHREWYAAYDRVRETLSELDAYHSSLLPQVATVTQIRKIVAAAVDVLHQQQVSMYASQKVWGFDVSGRYKADLSAPPVPSRNVFGPVKKDALDTACPT